MTTLPAQPMRHPDVRSRMVMTRRAWWLVVLNVVIPGSAQAVAGNRRLGRFGLGCTLLLWAVAVLAVLGWFLWRTTFVGLVANPFALTVLSVVAVFYAVVWVVLTLDTLRLVRLVKTAPGARGLIAGFAVVVLALVSGVAGYGAYVATTASGLLSTVFAPGPTVDPVDGRYNILLLGGDSGPDREGMRPDSMTVASIDAATGQVVLIGLPRDLQNAPFPEDSPLHEQYPDGYGVDGCDVDVCQLNSIYSEVTVWKPELYPDAEAHHSEPGIDAMVDAAEGITGLTIQWFGLIDMQGFQSLIDALGGVEMDVTERIPKGGDVDEDGNVIGTDAWIEPGRQRLDGNTALWYARARHGSSDYDRMARQRQLQEAILAQFTPANVLTKFGDVAAAGADTVKTDIPQGMLAYFVVLADKSRALPVISVELTPDGGVDPEDPDYGFIRGLVASAIAPPSTAPGDPADG